MNQISRDRLYKLLPAIYQLRDAAEGEPLKALLAVIEQEVEVIEENIGDLYDNWFIETCAEWVIPYLGDLLDVRELYATSFPPNQPQNPSASPSSQTRPYGQQERRAYVANTLAYRRRKGTNPILEQLVQDVTGWRARAVEFSRLLLTTQNLNHLRSVSLTVDLRNRTALELMGTPFEQQAAFTADLQQASQGGRYNVPNIGLFIWRLPSYPIERNVARNLFCNEISQPAGRFYTFNPLGYQASLFNQPQSDTDITMQAQEINVPAPLRSEPLANELQDRQQYRLQGKPLPSPRYFNESSPVLQIFLNGQSRPIPPEEMLICRLTPTDNSSVTESASALIENPHWILPSADSAFPPKVVAVDPELGCIAFLDRHLPQRLEVSYLYGFSEDLGGGSYSRQGNNLVDNSPVEQGAATPENTWINPLFWHLNQLTSPEQNPLATAIQTWNNTVLTWQDFRKQLHIPLAQITIPPVHVSVQPQKQSFSAGIVKTGFDVLLGCSPTEILVTPGLALDRQGRRLEVCQIETLNLQSFDLGLYSGQIGQFILVICYRAALEGQSYQFALVPETAIGDEGYPLGTLIPLARLKLSADKCLIGQPDVSIRSVLQFQSGIIQGLTINVQPGTFSLVIAPGTAVNEQGNVFVAATTNPFDLQGYQGRQGFLVLAKTRGGGQQWQVEFLADNVDQHICLAQLDIPSATVSVNPVAQIISGVDVSQSVNSTTQNVDILISAGEVKDCKNQSIQVATTRLSDIDLSNNRQLSQYPGQISSLVICTGVDPTKGKRKEIRIIDPDTAYTDFENYILLANLASSNDNKPQIEIYPAARLLEGLKISATTKSITVTKGIALDSQGQEIKLAESYQFDLSAYTARHLVLFISLQPRQGLPLEPISPPQMTDWRQLGIVPLEPIDPIENSNGLILINDNLSYVGDLKIAIPQGKQLKILAADGYRPHINGNIAIQGIAPAPVADQGELILEGLLIEGQMTILPGNLKLIQVNHSTLVPEKGGLQVLATTEIDPCPLPIGDEEDEFSPIALMMMMIVFIQSVLQPQKNSSRPPAEQFKLLTQLIIQEISRQLLEVWQVLPSSVTTVLPSDDCDFFQCLPADEEGTERLDQNNDRLEIIFNHSICGPLDLSSNVPLLRIENSIIDKGQPKNSDRATSGLSIWAPDTDTKIFTTTVLGMTHVRSLEADNSIFTEKVTTQLRQAGCIRFSYIPEGSQTPSRYQCQPDLVFQESLDPIPNAITSITHDGSSLFSSSAGGGIFRLLNNGQSWEKITRGLANPYVATVVTYIQPGIGKVTLTPNSNTLTGFLTTVFTQQLRLGDRLTIDKQTRQVIAILNDGELTIDRAFDNLTSSLPYAFEISTVLAGTTGGKLFRSTNTGDDWVPLAIDTTTATITVLQPYNWPLSGTVSADRQQIQVNCAPTNANFRSGDTILVNGEIRLITNILDDHKSITTLNLNAPLNVSYDTITFDVNTILAATAGDGILRGNMQGENWIEINQDLPNLDIRALTVRNLENQPTEIVVGTAGDGVFQMTPGIFGNKLDDRWIPCSTNLKNRNITELLIDRSGIILAGTAGEGVFRFQDETEWIPVNQNLSNLDITALAICTITGTVTNIKEKLIGQKTFFLEEGLQPGDSITILSQSGIVKSIESNTSLTLEMAFITDLPSGTGYKSYSVLIAATSDGKLFRSVDGGDHWYQLSLDLKGLDFTSLTVDDKSERIFTGTVAGSIYRSDDGGDSWFSVNNGLPNVAEKMLILERLQPIFTSDCYGDPGYIQLNQSCANEIRTGAEDGAEMGVFNLLKQPQREANLNVNLEEYLRFGLEAGIFYIT
jgi:hypothetical protein